MKPMAKFQAKLTAKFDRILQTDAHITDIFVEGDDLDEINENAVEFLKDYKVRNNIEQGVVEYYLGTEKGVLGSSLDVVGRV
jgi:methyl coenzyme M reductase alpha subunit